MIYLSCTGVVSYLCRDLTWIVLKIFGKGCAVWVVVCIHLYATIVCTKFKCRGERGQVKGEDAKLLDRVYALFWL
jgi:hypothetical protein